MLIQVRIYIFKEINRIINKRHKAKKTRIQQRGVLSIQNTNTLLNVKEVDTQLEEEMRMNSRSRNKGYTTVRRYSNYGEPKHNARTYKKDKEMSNIYSSN